MTACMWIIVKDIRSFSFLIKSLEKFAASRKRNFRNYTENH